MERHDDVPCVQINCPELFARPDFREWLNRRVGKGLATWHTCGEPGHTYGEQGTAREPGEYSDVFLVYDQGEGDESPRSAPPETAMPEACWALIEAFCEGEGLTYAILRLTNFDE